jgi:M6 family metalloprotease-like protein
MKLWKHIASSILIFCAASGHAQTLEDFGYRYFSPTDGPSPRTAPIGTGLYARKCLVILVDNANTRKFSPLLNDSAPDWYASHVFDASTADSVNSALLENSCGRFSLAPALGGNGNINGVIGPLALNPAEAAQFNADTGASADGTAALSAAVRSGFPLADFDLDGDHVVDAGELTLLVVANGGARGRGQTSSVNYSIPGGGIRCRATVSSVPISTVTGQFSTVFHEFLHAVGNLHDYYYYTTYLGLPYTLGSGVSQASDSGRMHLDPWQKLRFGWNEPKIVSMRKGGIYEIPATQFMDATAPILLYDPLRGDPLLRGTGEFFMLEYRTKTVPFIVGYESDLGSEGLFIWHYQQLPSHEWVVSSTSFNLTGTATKPWAAWVEGPPSIAPAAGTTPDKAWPGGRTTGYLRWNDGSASQVRIRAHPFETTYRSITVEILSDHETWVDFSYNGVELGTSANPWRTFLAGWTAVGHGGLLRIKSGYTMESVAKLDKPMTLTAENGPVTIGKR